MAFDNPFGDATDNPPKKKRRKRTPEFAQPLNVSPERVREATGTGRSRKHGKFMQLTFRLPEEDVKAVGEWAEFLGMSKEDVKRYIVWRGLLALEEGERPEFDVVEVKKLKR